MQAKKDCNAFKILVDSIYEKGEGTLEGSVSFGDEGPKDERNPLEFEMTTFPLKFSFPWEQSNETKKSECDPEEKELWDDLEFALRAFEIGSPDSNLSKAQKIGLVDKMGEILLEFPSLVVFDDGHTPRNDQSHMWKAFSSGKVADDKEKHATEVKAQIAPFVHVYKGFVLQDSLPSDRSPETLPKSDGSLSTGDRLLSTGDQSL
ncbi:PREDICTED: SNF2 domain-containing CLASSY [Prunus dulcis]|uniref:PREDICTED: SNF2 domain-containing CLASSY n=1 Tax=Prunus dulcis TaxID=3755 RepID=A0A5E4FA51_PRUDU|nr:PREDICTED: SNF2 domain-containing CLASSY [Prunus dulcis]